MDGCIQIYGTKFVWMKVDGGIYKDRFAIKRQIQTYVKIEMSFH